jgi:hypothetical protein
MPTLYSEQLRLHSSVQESLKRCLEAPSLLTSAKYSICATEIIEAAGQCLANPDAVIALEDSAPF